MKEQSMSPLWALDRTQKAMKAQLHYEAKVWLIEQIESALCSSRYLIA